MQHRSQGQREIAHIACDQLQPMVLSRRQDDGIRDLEAMALPEGHGESGHRLIHRQAIKTLKPRLNNRHLLSTAAHQDLNPRDHADGGGCCCSSQSLAACSPRSTSIRMLVSRRRITGLTTHPAGPAALQPRLARDQTRARTRSQCLGSAAEAKGARPGGSPRPATNRAAGTARRAPHDQCLADR